MLLIEVLGGGGHLAGLNQNLEGRCNKITLQSFLTRLKTLGNRTDSLLNGHTHVLFYSHCGRAGYGQLCVTSELSALITDVSGLSIS